MTVIIKKVFKQGAATAKAKAAKAKPPKEPKECPFKDKEDFAAFATQHPKTAKLLGVVQSTWRMSRAKHLTHPGLWAAYPYEQWSAKTGLPNKTLKRHLNQLENLGLIERVLGQFKGRAVYTYMRPTLKALKLSGSYRPGDADRYGKTKPTKPTITGPVKKPAPGHDPDGPPATLEEVLAIFNAPDDE